MIAPSSNDWLLLASRVTLYVGNPQNFQNSNFNAIHINSDNAQAASATTVTTYANLDVFLVLFLHVFA